MKKNENAMTAALPQKSAKAFRMTRNSVLCRMLTAHDARLPDTIYGDNQRCADPQQLYIRSAAKDVEEHVNHVSYDGDREAEGQRRQQAIVEPPALPSPPDRRR